MCISLSNTHTFFFTFVYFFILSYTHMYPRFFITRVMRPVTIPTIFFSIHHGGFDLPTRSFNFSVPDILAPTTHYCSFHFFPP